MYRIGEFSYLFKVTLKTLRHYDKIGLFSPAKVDEFTGYRYYDDTQVEEFKKILALKELKFSLEDIKTLKESATNEFLLEKLQEVNNDLSKSKQKINLLQEMLRIKGGSNIKYKVGFITNPMEVSVGRYVNLKSREYMDNEFEKIFDELKKLKNKAGIKKQIDVLGRLAVNEEIGYKEEDIEMFLGFIIRRKDLDVYTEYLHILRENNFIVRLCGKEPEGLAVINIPKTDNISDVYSSIINYAKNNNIQIRGSFEEYYCDDIKLYVEAYDLNRENLYHELHIEHCEKATAIFQNNESIIGSWKIKEILPGVRFNPNKQKSIPVTKYDTLEIYQNGKTNYDNITWCGKYLIIQNNNIITYNSIYVRKMENTKYLEILMDGTESNERPISYIYEEI